MAGPEERDVYRWILAETCGEHRAENILPSAEGAVRRMTSPVTDILPRNQGIHRALHPITIERVFTTCMVEDMKEVVVLDGIDILPDRTGFRVRSHDLHGQLPEIVVKDSGDTFQDKEQLRREACKLWAIVRLRDQMTL